MDAQALRELQSPLKARYQEDPKEAQITLKAQGTLGDNLTCKVETGRVLAEAGLHPATGGDGLSLCSGDMLLEALVACAGVTLNAVATAMGIVLNDAEVHAEGDFDVRGTLGVSKEASVGFSAVRLHFVFGSPADEDAVAKLIELTERYCVVYQTLQGGVPLSTTYAHQA